MAENSVESYRRDVLDFLGWNELRIGQYRAEHVSRYLAELLEAGLVYASAARKRVALKQIFGFQEDNGEQVEVDFDQVPKIKP